MLLTLFREHSDITLPFQGNEAMDVGDHVEHVRVAPLCPGDTHVGVIAKPRAAPRSVRITRNARRLFGDAADFGMETARSLVARVRDASDGAAKVADSIDAAVGTRLLQPVVNIANVVSNAAGQVDSQIDRLAGHAIVNETKSSDLQNRQKKSTISKDVRNVFKRRKLDVQIARPGNSVLTENIKERIRKVKRLGAKEKYAQKARERFATGRTQGRKEGGGVYRQLDFSHV